MKNGKDIQIRAFSFSCRTVRLHGHLVKKTRSFRSLSNQLLRAGTSLGANLEEAEAAQSKPDFISKCNIVLKEAREAHYWLRLISACELLPASQVADLTNEANQLVAILTSIVKNSRRNKN